MFSELLYIICVIEEGAAGLLGTKADAGTVQREDTRIEAQGGRVQNS